MTDCGTAGRDIEGVQGLLTAGAQTGGHGGGQ